MIPKIRITVDFICGDWWVCGCSDNGSKTGWVRVGPTANDKELAQQIAMRFQLALRVRTVHHG